MDGGRSTIARANTLGTRGYFECLDRARSALHASPSSTLKLSELAKILRFSPLDYPTSPEPTFFPHARARVVMHHPMQPVTPSSTPVVTVPIAALTLHRPRTCAPFWTGPGPPLPRATSMRLASPSPPPLDPLSLQWPSHLTTVKQPPRASSPNPTMAPLSTPSTRARLVIMILPPFILEASQFQITRSPPPPRGHRTRSAACGDP